MKNPNGPSREEMDDWKDALADTEEKRLLGAATGSAQRREIACPQCHAKVVDNGKRDEITQDWIAECVCGWWRKIVLPIAPEA